jgi:GNAT superfamily N-acetyltransferase
MIGLYPLVRPLADDDRVRLQRMFLRLSPRTVHRRFFTLLAQLDGPVLERLVAVDHERHEALVAAVGDEIVALVSYHRQADDPSVADIAVLVEDGWQHHGLGRRLVRQLTRLARQRGVMQFHADVLADNDQAIGLIRRTRRAGGPRATFEGGELAYDLPLTA